MVDLVNLQSDVWLVFDQASYLVMEEMKGVGAFEAREMERKRVRNGGVMVLFFWLFLVFSANRER